jgi:hypothetical protein
MVAWGFLTPGLLEAVNLSGGIGELTRGPAPFGDFADWLDLEIRHRFYLHYRHDLLRCACPVVR